MNRWWIVGIIFVLIFAGAVVLVFFLARQAQAPIVAVPASLGDLIVVDSPLPNASVTSPLTVTGKARGSWYFEGVFPVELLLNAPDGGVVARGTARAQNEWTTTDYVPFTTTLTFDWQPAAGLSGILVLKNDNPSGDPSKQKELGIPVIFK